MRRNPDVGWCKGAGGRAGDEWGGLCHGLHTSPISSLPFRTPLLLSPPISLPSPSFPLSNHFLPLSSSFTAPLLHPPPFSFYYPLPPSFSPSSSFSLSSHLSTFSSSPPSNSPSSSPPPPTYLLPSFLPIRPPLPSPSSPFPFSSLTLPLPISFPLPSSLSPTPLPLPSPRPSMEVRRESMRLSATCARKIHTPRPTINKTSDLPDSNLP